MGDSVEIVGRLGDFTVIDFRLHTIPETLL